MEDFYLKQAENNKPLEINMIDFEFVKSCDKPGRLKKALKILEDDGGHYQELAKEIKKKLLEIDPKYKLKEEQNNISSETRAEVSQEIKDFLEQMDTQMQQDRQMFSEYDK